MRLICTITDHDHENPYEFSYYLASQGIENECEEALSEGKKLFRIWVYEEDYVKRAEKYYAQYQANPRDPRYRARYEAPIVAKEESLSSIDSPDEEQTEVRSKTRSLLSPAPYGPVSILILLTVITLFMWAQIQRGTVIPPKIPGVIQAPVLAPIEQNLLYDYPAYFHLRDTLLKVYTPQEIEQKQPPSTEAKKILQEIKQTPVWMGIYDRFVTHYHHTQIPLKYTGPMFEKISQGEVWRLFTPALLHLDILHIFFNVLWFILLGNQIEFRLGWWRYLLLILATGIVANTAQYLMSGPFFLGLSGIVVGMAAFIWARQQRAPWEGYLLHRLTLIFLGVFVLGMFLLQVTFFFMQIGGKFEPTIGIANTAHLAGGIVGYLLGRMRFFAIGKI